MSDEIFEEIGRFDDDYAPKQGQLPGIDKLPDGTYDFEIASVELARTPNSGMPLLRTGLRVGSGGVFEWVHFLDKQDKVDRCGADLAAVGLPEFASKGGFSAALKKALTRMKGMRFRATKSTDTGKDGKKYHNIFVAGPISGAARTPPPAARPAANGSQPTQSDTAGEILPF